MDDRSSDHDAPAVADASEASDVQAPPRGVGATLRKLGPGIIVAGSIVGSGELIATTKVGAEAGFWLLWLIVVGCVIKVFAQVELGRYTITWSQTGLQALNTIPGPRWKVNWLLWYWALMTVLIITQQGGIVGGVGQVLAINQPLTDEGLVYTQAQDTLVNTRVELARVRLEAPGSAQVTTLQQDVASMEARLNQMPTPPDSYLWAGLLAVLTSALLYVGQYGLIERVATVFVGAFTAVTIATLFLLQATDWAVMSQHIAEGFSFQLPPIGDRFSDNPLATALAAFGLIGLGSGELIMYPYWCLEKGYAQYTGLRDGTKSWLKRAKGWIRVLHTDAWLSMGVYTFATVAFYLLGAAVLWRSGLNPAGQGLIRTLAEMYVPVFGPWAYDVFLLGAFAVLYSTFFVVAAGYARIVADGLQLFGLIGSSKADRARWTQILSVAWPIIAAVIYAFLRAPAAMVLASGVAQAVMLPMLGFAALYFRYRRTDPDLAPSRIWNVMLWLSFAGLLIAGLGSLYSTFVG